MNHSCSPHHHLRSKIQGETEHPMRCALPLYPKQTHLGTRAAAERLSAPATITSLSVHLAGPSP